MLLSLNAAAAGPQFLELTALRDAHTRVYEATRHQVFMNPVTGQPTSLEVDVPSRIMEKGTDINYLDDQDVWQKTDTTIRAAATGGGLEAVKQRAKLRFSALNSSSFNVEYSIDGGTLRTGVRALALLNPVTGQRHVIATAQPSTPVADGNRAVYQNVFPGADVEYVNNNVTFEQNLILREDFTLPNPATYGMNPASAMLVIITELDLSGTDRTVVAKTREGDLNMRQAALADASVLEFRNAQGKAVHRFETGFAWSGVVAQRAALGGGIPVWKRFQWTDGKLYLLEGLRYGTFARMERPVVIDYVQRTSGSGKNEVWDQDKTWWISAPYDVTNCTLVIEPGTVVKLGDADNDNDECINVNAGGTVVAVGEPYLPIFFTAYTDDGYGEDLDGVSGLPTEATPTRGAGNYRAVFHFDHVDNNKSKIQFCRIRWALNGILNERSKLNYEVRDNIFNECQMAVTLHNYDDLYETPPGVDPQMALTNNLIHHVNIGVSFSAAYVREEDYYSLPYTLDLYCNTVADCACGAVQLDSYTHPIIVYLDTNNNLFVNCGKGYGDGNEPGQNLDLQSSSITFSHTGFAVVGQHSEDRYEGSWGEFSSTGDPTYQYTSPFADNANGDYYLDQDNDFVDAGDGSLSTYGLTNFTTKGPVEKNCTTNYTTQTWVVSTTETGAVDLGFHHPRVDYIVGVEPGSTTPDQATVYLGNLTIQKSVVVAFFRPPFVEDREFFTNLICFGNLAVNTGIAQTPASPFNRDDMVHFDSSYYLGTNFFDRKWINGEYAHGLHTEAGTVWAASTCNYPNVRATLFRHMYIGLVLDGCKAKAPYNYIKGCVFERGDAGLFNYELAPTGSGFFEPSTLYPIYNLYLNLNKVAIYLESVEEATGYVVNFTNSTVLNCEYAAWLDGTTVQDACVSTVLQCDVNAIVGCNLGIGGATESGLKERQRLLFGHVFTVTTEPASHDCFWNNGLGASPDSPTDVDTAHVDILFSTAQNLNPRFVSRRSAASEREWQSVYLAQRQGDASLMPLRVANVAADSTVLANAHNWPASSFEVSVYGLDAVNSWSSTLARKAKATVSGDNVWNVWYNPSGTAEGDLLIAICRVSSQKPGSGYCSLDLRFANHSVITMVFEASVIRDIPQNATLCLWIGLDGSAFYASGNHSASSTWANMVSQNARYAMWYDSSALMKGYWDAVQSNAAIDIYPNDLGSNGYTSTDGTIDDNRGYVWNADTQEYIWGYYLDVGYHYQGWDYFEQEP